MAQPAVPPGGAASRGSAFRDSVRLLSRNPDFTKATLAGGLLASGTVMSPVMPLVMVGLRTRVWGERMTEFTAIVNSSNGVMAMLASGLVGRMSDRMDRRVAAAIIGVMGFLPTWVLLLCGLNWVGLWGFSLATALGGVACITASGCPTMYALVNDTMPPGDREMVYGIAFSALIVIAGVCTAGGFAISQAMGDSPEAVLLYMATLHVVYFLVLASIGKAHRVTADDGAGGEVAITSPQGSARLGEEGEGEVDGGSSDEGSSGSSSGGEEISVLSFEDSAAERYDKVRQSYLRPDLRPTTRLARELSLIRTMLQWNMHVGGACCSFHAGIRLLSATATKMTKEDCLRMNWSEVQRGAPQCTSCGLLVLGLEQGKTMCQYCEQVWDDSSSAAAYLRL